MSIKSFKLWLIAVLVSVVVAIPLAIYKDHNNAPSKDVKLPIIQEDNPMSMVDLLLLSKKVNAEPLIKPKTKVVPVAVVQAPPAPQPAPVAVKPKVVPKPVYKAPILSITEAQAKAFIYQKESGNNPNAVNSIGCRGLGQACPGSKLPCGADYACQDAWFTGYMQQRYGSWTKAYQFWIKNHWW